MDFVQLRDHMVEKQIRARGITQAAVLEALRRVPRHAFVPEEMMDRAYEDGPLSIGEGQTISQPYIVALMTQSLNLDKTKRVLEVGTGCGYQTAVLAELCGKVFTIERIESLIKRARQTFKKCRYTNIKFFLGDGTLGLPESDAPFDAIMVTAATPARPDHLLAQLALNGRLVAPVGDRSNQTLMLFTNTPGQVIEEVLCGCTFVPLIGEHGWTS